MNSEQRIETMRQRLEQALPITHANITDDSHQHIGHAGAASGAGHFTLEISSPAFDNESRVTCHRKIYDALGDLMQTEIHALRIKIIA